MPHICCRTQLLSNPSSNSSPQTPIDSAARPPRKRLDSLKSNEPSSRSASPAARRGTPSRGRKPVALPPFAGRRSKEERDARNQEAIERERERNRKLEALERKKEQQRKREEDRKRGGGARARGGFSGATSGPFSLGSATQGRSSHRVALCFR